MNPKACSARCRGQHGFTLVELLVTITILGILAAMVSGALVVARQSARIAATKATIAKIDKIIMAKYESYRTRRVPIDTTGMSPLVAAQMRLAGIRDLMRMEMPERLTDIFNVDANGDPVSVRGPHLSGMPTPALLNAYATRAINPQIQGWRRVPDPSKPVERGLQQAECLYMIVAVSGGSEALRQFRGNEIGDINGNGLPEFLDGWGRPISFLRWAPGFNDSDVQWNVVTEADLDATTPGNESAAWTASDVLSRRQQAAEEDHDPFDPRHTSMARQGDNPFVPRSWRLAPLIYSAGADGELSDGPNGKYVEYGIGAFPKSGSDMWWGSSGSPDDHYVFGFGIPHRNSYREWVHFDNIHNHRLEVEAE